MTKDWYIKFDRNDWLADMVAIRHPLEVNGAWINTLSMMPETGTVTMTVSEWASFLNVDDAKTLEIWRYIERRNIGDVLFDGDMITVTSRRMERDYEKREKTRKAGAKRQATHRAKIKEQASNAPITPIEEKKTEEKKREKKKKEPNPHLQSFRVFYLSYPNHKARADAEKAWLALALDAELVSSIMGALSMHKVSESWLKEDGKFVPLPASWIRGKRWEDQIIHGEPDARDF